MSGLFDIGGKVAVVTGGAGVLGGSIAKYLCENGVKVAILDRTTEGINEKLNELSAFKDQLLGVTTDVLDIKKLQEAKVQILQKWNRIDFLLNVAGGNMPGATINEDQTIFDMNVADFNKVTDLNLNGTVYPSLVFGEQMGKQKNGGIINITSMATMSAITRVPGYSVAKSGVEIFTKWMAMEMATKFSENIRVNAVAPGFFIGNQNRKVLIKPDGSFTERSEKVIAKTPMGRFGDISELNGTIHYLCTAASSFVTGTIIPVDGGFSSFSGV